MTRLLCASLGVTILAFGCGAFVAWDINPGAWDFQLRLMIVVMMPFGVWLTMLFLMLDKDFRR